MVLKAASILTFLVVLSGVPRVSAASAEPKQGQNFEQDLQLAKELFSLERRTDAIRLLNRHSLDDRATKVLNLMSTEFYHQDTANIYYEAIRLIEIQKWSEARERLDAALAKEPGNGLVLLRMIQVESLLKQKDRLADHLKLALDLTPQVKELKLYAAKAALDAGEEKDAYRGFSAQKAYVLAHPTLTMWWLDTLLAMKKISDIQAIADSLLRRHPDWSYVLWWFLKNEQGTDSQRTRFRAKLDQNLKDLTKYRKGVELENQRTQFFWAGYETEELLKKPIPQKPSEADPSAS